MSKDIFVRNCSVWTKIRLHFPVLPKRWGLDELLMSLYFLKTTGVNLDSTCSCFHVHKQTMMKKLEITLMIINDVLPPVFSLYFFEIFSILIFRLTLMIAGLIGHIPFLLQLLKPSLWISDNQLSSLGLIIMSTIGSASNM